MTSRCSICGREFEYSKDMRKHKRTCGVSRLSDHMNTGDISKLNEVEFEQETKQTRQIDLETRVLGSCVKCGTQITSEDSYNGLDSYVECPECEKVHNVEMLKQS